LNLYNAIKTRSTAYSNFSVLGLSLPLAIGSLIILLHLSLSSIVARLQEKSDKGQYRRLEWKETSVLQLQRFA
jgi:hypothetical protein